MYTPFSYAFAYTIKQTPYAFVSKIILCMYLLYDTAFKHKVADWSILISLSYRVVTEPAMEIQYILSPFISRI